VVEGDYDRLNAELQKLEEKLKFLESEQARLLNECAELED
jgi:tetrahydromethanopterin S-methyltransferase subunit G